MTKNVYKIELLNSYHYRNPIEINKTLMRMQLEEGKTIIRVDWSGNGGPVIIHYIEEIEEADVKDTSSSKCDSYLFGKLTLLDLCEILQNCKVCNRDGDCETQKKVCVLIKRFCKELPNE